MVKTKKFIFAKHFVGEPKEDDFTLVEEELPPLMQGDVLCEAVWLSVDPYMRTYSENNPTGATMIGSQVARVLESRNPEYKVGTHIVGHFGWQTRTVFNVNKLPAALGLTKPFKIPDFSGRSLSLALGVLGMPGNTAYFGFFEICRPKPGEVVVVSGAAGAVGSHVGQLAKLKGCKVIGFAGSDENVNWLIIRLGFDMVFNYNTTDITPALKMAAPKGVDCYFDNVGGTLSSAVIAQMKERGRILVCGSTSSYNADDKNIPLAPILQPSFTQKQLVMEEFLAQRWEDRWEEGINFNLQLIKERKLIYHQSITCGFENIVKEFIAMLRGEDFGKVVVKT